MSLDDAAFNNKGRCRAVSESAEDSSEWTALQSLYDDVSHSISEHEGHKNSVGDASDGAASQVLSDDGSNDGSCKSKDIISKWKELSKKCHKHALVDPWLEFGIGDLPVQNCIRYRYSSIRKRWSQDRVQIKMHPEPFARGAMRECYRVKKLSTFRKSDTWVNAQNYVAKKYVHYVDRQVLFEDVKLQMDSKLWAEEFNRHNPPKKIDIMQMSILEFVDEPGCPLYHLEHFIEGEYLKYNSNSGFVSEIARMTPQAFSHFTFERSGHQLIVVDVQGVGDLYTDPQIHTVCGTDYGDGNLCTRGMALFFHSHLCNDICRSLDLTEFDLSASETRALTEGNRNSVIANSSTVNVNSEMFEVCSSLVADDDEDAMEVLRMRSTSTNSHSRRSSVSYGGMQSESISSPSRNEQCPLEECFSVEETHFIEPRTRSGVSECASLLTDGTDDERPPERLRARMRFDSVSSCCSSRITWESEKESFWMERRKISCPAGFLSELEMNQLADVVRGNRATSTLGQIHLDLARYHELGRFITDAMSRSSDKKNCAEGISADEIPLAYDRDAALFHLDVACRCGILEAVVTVAEMAYGMPHELLKDVSDDKRWGWDDQERLGLELMESAAEMGDRRAMLFVAEAYETGRKLGKSGSPSWERAVEWYSRAASMSEDDVDESTGGRPRYEILCKIAELFKEGGYGLDQDFTRAYELFTEAAEAAIEAMKGKLANKLYELAEQCAA